MKERLSTMDIDEILERLKLENPFRAVPEVEKDFQLGREWTGDEDVFVRFVREELRECSHDPEKAVARLLKDMTDVEVALSEMEEEKFFHPFFCSGQVQVVRAYLGGVCKEVLLEKTREEVLDYVNGPASDALLRLMLAATDERNGFTPREIQSMFETAYKQVVGLEETIISQETDTERGWAKGKKKAGLKNDC